MSNPSRGKAVMDVESMAVSTKETSGHDIPSIDPLVGGEIHIAPIVVSHTEVNILKFLVFFVFCLAWFSILLDFYA